MKPCVPVPQTPSAVRRSWLEIAFGRLVLFWSFSIALALVAGCTGTVRAQSLSPDEARAIAKKATIYGFPLVDSYRIQYSYFVDRNSQEFKAPWNTLSNTS
jgi:hypothetical protein